MEFTLCVFSFVRGHSLRYLAANQLTGTIPTELVNLTKLRVMYAENRIFLLAIQYCLVDIIICSAFY